MKNLSSQKQTQTEATVSGKQYSYSEIIEFLDARWDNSLKDPSLTTIKKLDTSFGNLSQTLNTVIINGTNGKSLTAHFSTRLLKEEGLAVGTFTAPHVLTYNERFAFNNETIANKFFTDIANEVINTVTTLGLRPHALDLLTMIALVYFSKQKADVAILEVTDTTGTDPVMICKPKITAITRITDFDQTEKGNALLEKTIKATLSAVSKDTHVVSADQSKMSLQIMQKYAEEKGGIWAMPIRKLAQLPYPFEQLHGRSAALAERIAQLYVNSFLPKNTVIVSNSLLVQQKGQRGRPTLEAKRKAELNPRRTVDQFWKEAPSYLPGRFQLLDKEKPTILLDNAENLDSFQNLLLGIRLLHYHRPLKGLTLVIGNNNPQLNISEFLKLLRYFFKKTSGSVVVCPSSSIPGHTDTPTWDPEKVSNDIKSMKIKAKSAKTFKEAFEMAQKSVDERYGLVVVTGSSTLITEYWRLKGMKKL